MKQMDEELPAVTLRIFAEGHYLKQLEKFQMLETFAELLLML